MQGITWKKAPAIVERMPSDDETLRGVGEAAASLTVLVSADFAGGAGRDFTCEIVSLHLQTTVR